MAKKILLIENDMAFAGEATRSLESTGFDVRVTGDGKEGLDLARDWTPDAIVLCVELPGMSGYLVCQKLRKDDAVKGIPLVLTSAEATEETFEKHRTLKARADEYLLKPFAPGALVELLGGLVGLPEAAEGGDEEFVTLEEEAGLEAADGEPDRELAGLDLQSLPDDLGSVTSGREDDEDLRLLDDAFDGLSAPAAEAADAIEDLEYERPVAGEDVDAASASLPEDDDRAARADLGALRDDADDALDALTADDGAPSPFRLDEVPPAGPVPDASPDLLRDEGLSLLDDEPGPKSPRRGPRLGEEESGSGDLARIERELADARDLLERAQADLASRDDELRELRDEASGLIRRAEQAEEAAEKARSEAAARTREAEAGTRETKRAADQAKAAETELAETRRKVVEAERRAASAESEAKRKVQEAAAAAEAVAKAAALEREADDLRTELLVARGEADGARGEVDKRTAELRKRLTDVEAQSAKNEERVVKAYQKIKADEKVREKVRKALTIAMQLLDDGLPAEPSAEKDRRTASLAGRE